MGVQALAPGQGVDGRSHCGHGTGGFMELLDMVAVEPVLDGVSRVFVGACQIPAIVAGAEGTRSADPVEIISK